MKNYLHKLIELTPSYTPAWNQETFKGKWNYIDGVFLNSIVNLYYTLKDTNVEEANFYKDFFLRYVNYYITEDGKFYNPKTESYDFKAGELDSICESKILFDAYDLTGDSRYLEAIEYTYERLVEIPRAVGTVNFSHKVIYPNQLWLDGMYMYVPFYARYALLKNKPEIFDEIVKQYEYVRKNAYSEEKGLYYHACDTSKEVFWCDKLTGKSKNFWLRSSGWFIVSLVDVLDYMPNGKNRDYILGLLNEAVNGILKYIDKDYNMFYQLVDLGKITHNVKAYYLEGLKNKNYCVDGTYKDTLITNYVESSGSSMIAYTLLKASRLGYIDAKYHKVGKAIYEGVYNHSFVKETFELKDICITAGLGPESNKVRDGSVDYYLAETVGSNDAKGVGPFIMAYIEYIR